jgi:hypothetical protein
MIFSWDDCLAPRATSDRGWCILEDHPDLADWSDISRAVGFYLDYGPPANSGQSRGPNGETIFACAYIYRLRLKGGDVRLGNAWFSTIAEAKEFIVGNVRAYFGAARDGSEDRIKQVA